jgi:hypothetical protein
MKTKGARGPLTLRCAACGRRNANGKHPITSMGLPPRINKSRSRYPSRQREILVRCSCGWQWFTNSMTMQ